MKKINYYLLALTLCLSAMFLTSTPVKAMEGIEISKDNFSDTLY